MNKTIAKQNTLKSRRRLLGALTVGAATAKLPEMWGKPIVESVLLPAHAVGTNETLVRGGGGGDTEADAGEVLRLLDGLVPKAHATGSIYPGCASFSWITNSDGTWPINSLMLDLLAQRCPKHSHLYQVLANKKMIHRGGDNYETIDGDYKVVLHMTNPFAGPGEQFGTCNVKKYLAFPVFRGETCTADHPDMAACDTCEVAP